MVLNAGDGADSSGSRPTAAAWLARSEVDLDVLREVVGAGKLLAADGAAKRLHPGVLALVSGELVRTRESPLTARPVAGKGSLPGVPAEVGLEMGALGVGLLAAGVGAVVDLGAVHLGRHRLRRRRWLAVFVRFLAGHLAVLHQGADLLRRVFAGAAFASARLRVVVGGFLLARRRRGLDFYFGFGADWRRDGHDELPHVVVRSQRGEAVAPRGALGVELQIVEVEVVVEQLHVLHGHGGKPAEHLVRVQIGAQVGEELEIGRRAGGAGHVVVGTAVGSEVAVRVGLRGAWREGRRRGERDER